MSGERRDDSSLSETVMSSESQRAYALIGGGEMGAAMRAHDWSQTALGPVSCWPQSLCTTVSTCLNSRFAILVFWGPEFVMLYNDAYRPMLGNKHPSALGQSGRTVWSEIWHIIGPMLSGVLEHGVATWSDNQHLQLERHGFVEDAYFTFSYSPVRDERGRVSGIFTAVAETTGHVLDTRRLTTLQEIAVSTLGITSVSEAHGKTMQALAQNPADLPFALLYTLDGRADTAELVEQIGLSVASARAASEFALSGSGPLARVAESGRAELLERVEEALGALALVDGRPAPHAALALPVVRPGRAEVAAVLVLGLSPRLVPDAKYRGFLELVAANLAAAIGSAQAYEHESRRAEALAQIDRAKTEFFSNVSHEFRTPLSLMLGPVEDGLRDLDEPLSPRQRERQLMVRKNALRLQKLVNTLLEFARIEAGRAHLWFVPTDLAALTRELASSFASAMSSAGIELVVDCPKLPELVYVDRGLWEKIVLNLLSNAFKFTFEGQVHVLVRGLGERVELRISDTGVGIAEAELPRIFERFHRVPNARGRSHEGTGIGLALVQELTTLHGGTVHVESVVARGTTFTVSLPTGSAHLPRERLGVALEEPCELDFATNDWLTEAASWSGVSPPASRSSWPLPSSIPPPAPTCARLLIADDNVDMRSYLTRLLSAHWTVQAVSDGPEALELARTRPPDLILCDVMMPGMDRLTFVRALRADERTRMVPIILLSARAGEDATIEGLASGADDYLVKPFSGSELIARVNAQLTVSALRREAVDGERAHTEEANRLLAESRRATQLREETLAVVSHDLRTPLTAIKMAADLLQLSLGQDERDLRLRKQTDSIRRSVARMNRLISDLLDLASIDAGTLSLEPQCHTASELLREVQETFATQAARKGLTLTAEVEPDLPPLEADRERLLQVLCNLLANALQFTPTGGKIRVRASSRPPGVLFSVSDTGRGIPTDALPHIFDRYWHSTLHGRDSHGLGLSIATGIVEAHGGRLEVESAPGEGSTFSFLLPLEPPPRLRSDRPSEGPVPGTKRR